MKITCQSCSSKYNIADDKVRGRKVKVRCKTCGTPIIVDGTEFDALPLEPPPSLMPNDFDDDEATRVMQAPSEAAAEAVARARGARPAAGSSSAAGADAEPWSVNLSDGSQRDLTTEEVLAAWQRGEITEEAFVWREGFDDWLPVLQAPELGVLLASHPQAAPPAAPSPAPVPASAEATPVAVPGGGALFAAPTPSASTRDTAGSSPQTSGTRQPASGDPPWRASQPGAARPATSRASQPGAVPPGRASQPGAAPKTTSPFDRTPAASPFKAPSTATGASTGRASQDLFGGVHRAGSEEEATRQAQADATAAAAADAKLTGARNENSVLFSLDSLKANYAPPAPPKKATPATNDDPFGMGGPSSLSAIGGNTLLGSSNQALLTAPVQEPPKPVKPAAPAPAPAMDISISEATPTKGKSKLWVAIVAVIGVIAAGAAAFLLLGPGASKTTDSSQTSEQAATGSDPRPADERATGATNERDEPEATGRANGDEKAAAEKDEKKDEAEAAGDDAEKDDTAQDKPAAATETSEPRAKTASDKPDPAPRAKKEASETKTEAPKEESKAAFDKGAAVSALSSAAGQASGCKKPDGPTGTGKAIVTFAPSGRVTSANVSGGAFGGTTVGGCVASVFRRARVPPFSGGPVTVSKSFTIP